MEIIKVYLSDHSKKNEASISDESCMSDERNLQCPPHKMNKHDKAIYFGNVAILLCGYF